ncbi:hypothetical protein LCGC14_1337820 [marine sediment metagenome]|uniref:Uncharacterized protein n=1 Tax=marine sediment metagenome TaxID=412755 RepID=A0A0F9NGV2_9ZZZZ
MSLGGNSRIKTIFHRQERVLVQELLDCYKKQIRDVQKLDDDFKQSYRWTELNAKIEVLEKLLGKR